MTNYVELNWDEAHDFVSKNAHRGYFWDGFEIVRWVPNENGYSSKNGMYKNDMWGFSFNSKVSEKGTWKLKNV
ncbi:hypothetical protein UFOVP1491_6 [uncultured Caudovirales phage]|uniref:Uncharacterized protein n=1 Tax=uncultured Caudovirales phage TaxID=2100421 RepID=A0A6J5QMG6_9CAUD|nr:hypothetical protein UFOVP485_115 [uncultured Caudovirales phage]CAB4150948.1 hypothetical protein UFOVP575_67 [uncultured Caudovirales phage]CAB4174891.1 hypothetical protein UFOVP963_93 [uncultured Caudovirales phage]CAB4179590.1 hypothetical protein UFOVP1032_6 [uncultured Caudovirales phage]CAB4185613.1 hypothetical protein UFOVP1125_74 [uncultured Caudovirales phage]